MWNVYQYLKDFGDGKVKYEDFISIYKSQDVLKKFIFDSYNDVVRNGLIELFKKETSITFPFENYKTINNFIDGNKDAELLKKIAKNLIFCLDRIYKY